MIKEYQNGIGLMSGTSLDGVDLAWCRFDADGERWNYRIDRAATIPYPDNMGHRLAYATELSALEYAQLNVDLGLFFATQLNQWIGQGTKPQFIASHGHTVFHQPERGLTAQIGSGAVIAARTGIPTVCDFRTTDVALHGQGAPLVPIGDELLFNTYDACLNLGGIANISFRNQSHRVAFDICPCNMALNRIAQLWGQVYDIDGEIASSGAIIPELLQHLNELGYYAQTGPKSLGKEWFETYFMPILTTYTQQHLLNNCQRTVTEHIASRIASAIPSTVHSLLITGGGAHNLFLIQQLEKQWQGKIIIPDPLTVDYKEALIFAFLGMLRLQGQTNCLSSVTGAERDSCCGCVYE